MTISTSDNVKLHTIESRPNKTPIGHIHILHGMAEHIGRYDGFIADLVSSGYVVTGHDHRGHGKTADLNGKLGHFGDQVDFDRIVKDAFEVIQLYRLKFSDLPFSLLGHSMGSFIARRYAQLYGSHLDKLICVGTAGDPGVSRIAGVALAKMRGRLRSFAQTDYVINRLVFGRYNQLIKNPKTSFDWLSANEQNVESYINDPYCGFVPTTGFFNCLFDGLKKIHQPEFVKRVPSDLPILLVSGSDDPVGSNSKAVLQVGQQFVQQGITDVTVMLYEGKRHEILQEDNRLDVFNFIKEWITRT